MLFPYDLIDLTHIVDDKVCAWDGNCGFKHQIVMDYPQGDFRIMTFHMAAGVGTHMDAPAHCFAQGRSIEQIAITELCRPAFVIDVSQHADENYLVGTKEILAFESRFGNISKDSLVFFYTGWERLWHDASQYRNNYQFPSISAQAAELLLTREVKGLGIDTLSPDVPDSKFIVHQLFLGQDKIILENVANLKHMPAFGGYVLALPPKFRGATEAPVRLVGMVKNV